MNALIDEDMSSDEPAGTVHDPAVNRILGKFRTFKHDISMLDKHEVKKLNRTARKEAAKSSYEKIERFVSEINFHINLFSYLSKFWFV